MSRKLIACLIVAAAVLAAPAATIASGPSAGNQQYTDPLAGLGKSSSTHTQTTPPPAQSPTPSPSSSGAVVTPSPSATTGTTATPATAPSAPDPSGNLPMTGFDARLGALLGACLLASGLYLRRIGHRT